MHCPGCCGKVPSNTLAHVGSLCPGVTCSQCAQNAVLIAELWEQLNTKDAEIARLQRIIDGHDLIMMRYQKAMDEIACLRALVAVGREMADVLDSIVGPDFPLLLVERWRRLEGGR